MNDNEKVQTFSDMVEATERLTTPWRKAFFLSNILWAIIVAMLVWFAYMTPIDMDQSQNQQGFETQTQQQYYSEGFGAHGN